MPDLNDRIVRWKAGLPPALQNEPATVAELEEHLREEVARLGRDGRSLDDAWAIAIARLGNPQDLAREFGRVQSRWLPHSRLALAVLVLTAACAIVINALVALRYFEGKMTALLLVHVLILTSGYLAVLDSGILGLSALMVLRRRPLTSIERRDFRRIGFWLNAAAGLFVPVGVGLGMVWASANLGSAWSWQPVETGALSVLVSSWLLLLAQTAFKVSDRAQASLASLSGIAVITGFLANKINPAMPVAWLCLALFVGQAAVVILRRNVVHVH